ncbi:MAG: hypothetical protein HEEMFOPI_02013 [Holosporales bacterium]
MGLDKFCVRGARTAHLPKREAIIQSDACTEIIHHLKAQDLEIKIFHHIKIVTNKNDGGMEVHGNPKNGGGGVAKMATDAALFP